MIAQDGHEIGDARGSTGGQRGGSRSSSEIASWVAGSFRSVTIEGTTFYDLTAPLSGTTTPIPVA